MENQSVMYKRMDQKWWVVIAIGTGSFMAALDGSVVNAVLPIIKDAFRSDVSAIQWVVTIYLLFLSGLLLTFGRLGDLHGHKSVYVWGFGIFLLGSILCGSAWSPTMLIVFRGLQAIGAAMLASNAPAIVTATFPPEKRGRAFGFTSFMTYIGLTVGPSLGGWLTHAFGWRSIFYINIPVGILAFVLSLLHIPKLKSVDINKSFDLPGAIFFLVGLGLLMLGLNKGSEWGWNSPVVIGILASSLLVLIIFVTIESQTKAPMLDLNLFRIPLFTTSTICAILNYICVYTITFLMPFYLIQGRGMNPAQAGLLLTAQPVLMAISAPISGSLSDKMGSRLPGMLGMAILAGGLFVLSRLGSETILFIPVLGLAIAGLGTGTFITPNTSALMGSAPRLRQGVASGVLATARNFGMVLGIGMAGAIFTTQLAQNNPGALYRGVDIGFMAAVGIALLGMVFSATKEK